MYAFRFLDACIAECGPDDFEHPASAPIDQCIKALREALSAKSAEIVARCRVVTHLTTESGHELTLGNITVVPEPAQPDFAWIQNRIREEIPAFDRAEPGVLNGAFSLPRSLLVARGGGSDSPTGSGDDLTGRLNVFLLIARLLTSGTAQVAFDVSGGAANISTRRPRAIYRPRDPAGQLLRRTVRLNASSSGAFEQLGSLVSQADVKREGMAATSFDVALSKFTESFDSESPYQQIVDLATALEAKLLGGERENDALTLRLRMRAAALLATDEDPSTDIFADIGHLYGLRSKLVHGGTLKENDLRRLISKISVVPKHEADGAFVVALVRASDRFRDLVRRSILARLCLAAGPNPLWSFNEGNGVDQDLSDTNTRKNWNAHWKQAMKNLGAGSSTDPVQMAQDTTFPEMDPSS